MGERIALVVVGVGHLGRHHLRLASSLPFWRCVGAYDTDRHKLEALTSEYGVPALRSLEEAVAACHAAIVATPTVSHREVAEAFLAAGKHVLVEKPLAATVEEGQALVHTAEAEGLVLGVGHVEFFNPAVQALLQRHPQPRYLETQRLSPFTRRSLDVDVICDLMIHDLHLVQALNGGAAIRDVRAVGVPVLSSQVDLANARLELDNGCVANLTASRVSSERVRRLRLFERDAYYSLDYSEQSVRGFRLQPGPERHIVPVPLSVAKAEPLAVEHHAFWRRLRGEPGPFVSGREGLEALRAAHAVLAALPLP